MALSNDKLETKRLLSRAGIPAAECAWLDAGGKLRFFPDGDWCEEKCDCIVKAVEAHASLYLDDASVLRGTEAGAVAGRLRRDEEKYGIRFFAERFVEGREFNLSVIERGDGGAEVFPVAEIPFTDLPEGRERIVGYAAKWDGNSEEYKGTPRAFVTGEEELTGALRRQALSVWEAFGFSGYCRVDFRLDERGRLFVLEANANPCLHPDSGFAAAASRGGLAYDALIMRLGGLALRAC